MYTIFFTINCVEQLTFSKTFVDQLQFEQLIFFCLKVKLLEIHVRQMIFDFRAVDKKSDICSNGVEQMKNCVEQFFRANEFWAVDHVPIKLMKSRFITLFQVNVYYESMLEETIAENPEYTFMSFLSSIGGDLSLYIGITILSFVEIAEFLFRLLIHSMSKKCVWFKY